MSPSSFFPVGITLWVGRDFVNKPMGKGKAPLKGVTKQEAEEKMGLHGVIELLNPSILEPANHPTSGLPII